MFAYRCAGICDGQDYIGKKVQFAVGKQELIICCQSWLHDLVNFNFGLLFFFLDFVLSVLFFFRLLLFLPIRLPLFIVILFIILILPLIFILILLLLESLFLINKNLHFLVLDSRNLLLLLFQLFFKEARKVIVLLVFFESIICFHRAMPSIVHVFAHSFGTLKIFCLLIFACDAHVANFDLFLQVLYKPFRIFTKLALSNKERVSILHMFLVLL